VVGNLYADVRYWYDKKLNSKKGRSCIVKISYAHTALKWGENIDKYLAMNSKMIYLSISKLPKIMRNYIMK
jgi:hypothetical protein